MFGGKKILHKGFARLSPVFVALGSVLSITAAGFFAYMILDRLTLFHTHIDDEHLRSSVQRGWAGAASLSAHSFTDGFAIGVAFQASTTAGYVVALAVEFDSLGQRAITAEALFRKSLANDYSAAGAGPVLGC